MKRVVETILNYAAGREIVLYGCGETGSVMLYLLENNGLPVSFFGDRRYRYIGSFHGREVKPVSALDKRRHYVVIASGDPSTIDSISRNLSENEFQKNKDFFRWYDNVDYDIVYEVSGGEIHMGKYSSFSKTFTTAPSARFIKSVGRYCSINVAFAVANDCVQGLSISHRIPIDNVRGFMTFPYNRIDIGHDVWIGANTFVNASKVKSIGNGAIIGTGAIVLEDVPPYAVVVGAPARIIKYRFNPSQIEILQRVQWWNWVEREIRGNSECFRDYNLFFERFG